MELKEFYHKLYELDWEWQQLSRLTPQIRRHKSGEGSWCPITAVAESETGTHYTMWDWGRAAQAIGLGSGDAQGIVDAADLVPPYARTPAMVEEIRKQILEAIGLQEWGVIELQEEAKI